MIPASAAGTAPRTAMGIFEIADTGGMICGFRLRADGPAQDVQWNVEAAPQTFPDMEGGPLWLHFTLVDSRAERWIAENPRIPEQARERLLEPNPGIRL